MPTLPRRKLEEPELGSPGGSIASDAARMGLGMDITRSRAYEISHDFVAPTFFYAGLTGPEF